MGRIWPRETIWPHETWDEFFTQLINPFKNTFLFGCFFLLCSAFFSFGGAGIAINCWKGLDQSIVEYYLEVKGRKPCQVSGHLKSHFAMYLMRVFEGPSPAIS